MVWSNYQPVHDGRGARADVEVLLNAAGRRPLAGLCGVRGDVLARALPSWEQDDAKLPSGVPVAVWRIGAAGTGTRAFGCRLCTTRRTWRVERVVRYVTRRQRVCVSGTGDGSWTRMPASLMPPPHSTTAPT